jgi:hypothetical protein
LAERAAHRLLLMGLKSAGKKSAPPPPRQDRSRRLRRTHAVGPFVMANCRPGTRYAFALASPQIDRRATAVVTDAHHHGSGGGEFLKSEIQLSHSAPARILRLPPSPTTEAGMQVVLMDASPHGLGFFSREDQRENFMTQGSAHIATNGSKSSSYWRAAYSTGSRSEV